MKIYYYLIIGVLIFSSCDKQYSRHPLHEAPEESAVYQQAALKALNEMIEDHPDNPDAYFKKAQLHLQSEEYEQALLNSRKAIGLDGQNPHYYELLAEVHYAQKDTEQAENNAMKAISLAENKGLRAIEAYRLLSVLAFEAEATEKAIDYINQAISLAPYRGEIYFQRGKIYLQAGDTTEALSNMNRALEDPETAPQFYSEMAELYKLTRQYDKALLLLDKQQQSMPESKGPAFRKAALLTEMDRTDEALAILRRLVREDTTFVQGYYQLGLTKYTGSRYDSALYFADRALQLDADNKEAMLLKGRIYDKRGKFYSARNEFQKILELDPEYKLAEEELRKVQRKIAYLRRLKEQKQQQEADSVPAEPKPESKQIESQEENQ